ncbi:MAG: hypothetical protein IRY99_00920 [Isosphaeraceae bacterium]|nr:hypothetical protein [Isosphaeraceae bacterium]
MSQQLRAMKKGMTVLGEVEEAEGCRWRREAREARRRVMLDEVVFLTAVESLLPRGEDRIGCST